MNRTSPNRTFSPRTQPKVLGHLFLAAALMAALSVANISAQPVQKPRAHNGPLMRPEPNRNNSAPRPSETAPAGNNSMFSPGRPDAQEHLSQWMNSRSNLTLAQKQAALEAEPGFRQLNPEQQQRMHQLLTRLNAMPPEKRQLNMARAEWMEHLQPQQRQQVRSTLAQLGSLPQDRAYAVGRAFHAIQNMPEPQRQAYLNSPQFHSQFNDQERGTINNLLTVAPLLPPANLGSQPPR